nr:AI-2E family transporter [Lachnospiraceae bacterium]
MNTDKKTLHKRILANLLVSLIVLCLIVFVAPKIIVFCLPLIIAWLVACIAHPMIKFLESKIKIKRKLGTIVVIVLVITLLLMILYGIFYLLATEAMEFSKDISSFSVVLKESIDNFLTIVNKHFSFLPDDLSSIYKGLSASTILSTIIGKPGSNTIKSFMSVSESVGDKFVLTILTIILTYFFAIEYENVTAFFKRNTPVEITKYLDMTKEIINKAIFGYFAAHFKIMFVIAVITVVPYYLLGVKHFILLAIVTGIVDFLPIFGTGTIMIPWGIYRLVQLDFKAAILLIGLYVVTIVVRQFLEPKLISDSVGISAFATVVFMLIGYRLDGMFGLLVSIPIGMIVVIFYRNGAFDTQIDGAKILLRDIYEYIHYKDYEDIDSINPLKDDKKEEANQESAEKNEPENEENNSDSV